MNEEKLLKQTPLLIVVSAPIRNIPLLFERIKQIENQRLYLFYDVPANEETKTGQEQIRSIFSEIEWQCKATSFYSKKHLGKDAFLRKAIRWFFKQETEGIILDGSLIPSSGALAFYSVLLEKYRHDERIGHIAGWNFLNEKQQSASDSYFFSKLVTITGCWGSWRRVWEGFDAQLKTVTAFRKQQIIEGISTHKPFRSYWNHFNYLKDSLDMQYEYINLINNRLTVVPNIRYDQIFDVTYKWNEIVHPLFITNNNTSDLKYQELKYRMSAITKNIPDGCLYIKDHLLHYAITDRMKIPKIIHQIYEDPAGPSPDLLTLASTWKKKHPDWEYRFWNRQMMDDFLKTKCPDFMPYYYSYPFNVQRWDAIRYLILYHIGGLYVDFDYGCIHPLDVLLCGQTCCMGMEPSVNSRICYKPLIVGNALMASTPEHPYMAAIIEDMKVNFSVDYRKGDSLQIMETTGPFMVSRVYEQFKRKKSVTLLSADLVTPLSLKEVNLLRMGYSTMEMEEKIERAFAVHYFFGSWFSQTAEGKIRQKIK